MPEPKLIVEPSSEELLSPEKADEFRNSGDQILNSRSTPAEQLSLLAKLLYRLVKATTNTEGIIYRNFYARFQYLLSRLPLTADGQRNLDAFRRFIKEGNTRNVTTGDIREGVSLLQGLIGLLSGQGPAETTTISSGYFSRLFPRRDYSALSSLKLLCSSWSAIQHSNGRNYFTLKGLDLLNLSGELEVCIWQDDRYDYTSIRSLLTSNMILGLYHIRYREGLTNSYETTYDTLIVVEPDFLVEATAVGECFSGRGFNSDIFFLSRLIPDLPGAPALKGSMIGYFLDEMIRNRTNDRDSIFLEAQRSFAMRAAALGSLNMKDIRSSIYSDHLPNIAGLIEKEKVKELWIEPTYFSVEFGLQGRLDLLAMDRTTDAKDIIELKSGSPSNPNISVAWRNHYMQVVCYDMMLQSTYGKDSRGSGNVYYSACRISPYRNVISKHEEKREALAIRNELVAKIYQLAAGDFSFLHKIRTAGVPGLPPYQEGALHDLQRLYLPEKITSGYYEEMMAFILRELINDKVGDQLREEEEDRPNGFAGLWLDSLPEKEHDFRILYELKVLRIREKEGEIDLAITRTDIAHAFRKGDPVILHPKINDRYDALTRHILKGSISKIGTDALTVSLNNKQTEYRFIREHREWAIQPDIFERNYWSQISCLFNVLRADQRKKRLLFGHEKPGFATGPAYANDLLTDTEANVIGQALNAEDYYLLQGPPGTGKTGTFLINYLRESLNRTGDKTVVLAFTNRAVDKICEVLREPRTGEQVRYLRLGSRHVSDESLFTELLMDDDPDNWRKIIDSNRVFVCTVATFQNNCLLLAKLIPFDQVVIDEASQLTEANLAGILALFKKFVLVGDYKQLPPVITQDDRRCLTGNHYLQQLGIKDLRISMFERLIRTAKDKGWDDAYGQLDDHYRMHNDIAALISHHYRKELVAGGEGQKEAGPPYRLPEGHRLYPLISHRAVFVECAKDAGFKRNEQEARLVADIATCLVEEAGIPAGRIGIITPFRAQIAAIRRHLNAGLLAEKGLVVDTVERYQGDERDIIIFSTVITNAWQIASIQSLHADEQGETDRKLLVSISRASKQLIVVGHAPTLERSGAYRDLLGRMGRIKLNGI
ncbi:MAG TPA: ATP-dependent helicase [Puia sp.]|jgi:hypothetical protein|nr:ATP-dependent helicase [Puia sp.]